MQERLERGPLYPWRVLVACALLNRTGRSQVRPMFDELFSRWRTPQALAGAGRELERLLRPLGLFRRRGALLRRLSLEWLEGRPVAEVHGVGKYALDAHAIFVEGRTDVSPEDGFLRKYLTWRIRDGNRKGKARARGKGTHGAAQGRRR